MASGIPDNVRRLVIEKIDSVRQLDVLLLLRESGPHRVWTVAELNAVLRSSQAALEHDLAGLLRAGLVEAEAGPPTGWRYAPNSSEASVDALAACYRTHRTAVITLVTSPQRTSSLSDFADAFNFRKKDPLDG